MLMNLRFAEPQILLPRATKSPCLSGLGALRYIWLSILAVAPVCQPSLLAALQLYEFGGLIQCFISATRGQHDR